MFTVIHNISTPALFVATTNLLLALRLPVRKEKIYSLLIFLAMITTFAILQIENHSWFLILWVWGSINLLFAALTGNKSVPEQFSRYMTYVFFDILFFFLAFAFSKFAHVLVLLPVIVRCNLIPFHFLYSCGKDRKLHQEVQLTTINFLMIFLFLLKFNVNTTFLSIILSITLFISSFGLLTRTSSTNTLMGLYTICLNLTILILVNNYMIFAAIAFLFFVFIFLTLSYLIPKNISFQVLKHNSLSEWSVNKYLAIFTLLMISLLPISFSSTIFLSAFEIVIFHPWHIGQDHSLAPVIFTALAWFSMNFHSAFMQLIKLILHNHNQRKCLPLFFLLLLPLILFLSSNYFFTGNLTLLNQSTRIPLSTITADLRVYLLYFYAPLLAFAASGFYLYSISSQLRLLPFLYRLVFELSSIHFIYRKVGFSTIQTVIKNLNHSVHEGMKIFPLTFTAIIRSSVNVFLAIRVIMAHFREKMLDIMAFRTGTLTVTRYTPITLLLLFFSTIAFLSDMKLSAPPVIFLVILTATTGYFLTATEEDKK